MVKLSPLKLLEIVIRHRARTQGPLRWYKLGKVWHLMETETGRRNVVLSTTPAYPHDHFESGDILAVNVDGRMVPLALEHPDAQALAHSWQDVEDLLQDRATTMELLSRIKEFAHRLPPDIEAELKEAPHGG